MTIRSLFSIAAFQARADKIQETLDTHREYAFAAKILLWLNSSLNWLVKNPPLHQYRFIQLNENNPIFQKISPIAYAILYSEDSSEVEALVKAGEDINLACSSNTTPVAIILQQITSAKEKGISTNGLENTLQNLVKAGAQIDQPILDQARTLELSDSTKKLLAINLLDERDQTPLMRAVQKDSPDAIDEVMSLLQKGASPLSISKNGNSAFSFACQSGNLLIVNTLLLRQTAPKKTVLNQANAEGITPLMISAKAGQKNVVHFLLKEGASLNLLDREGRSALAYAVFNNYPGSTQVLLMAKTFYGKSGRSMLNDEIRKVALSKGHEKARKIIENLAPSFLEKPALFSKTDQYKY